MRTLGLLVALGMLAACESANGSGRREADVGPADAAGGQATAGGDADPSTHASPDAKIPLPDSSQVGTRRPGGVPLPPVEGTYTPGGALEIVSVLKSLDFGDRPATGAAVYRSVGLDLDGLCGGGTGSTGCALPAWSDGSEDGPGCQDNAFGEILQQLRDGDRPVGSDAISSVIVDGGPTLLISVTGYNGEPNDDRVRLEVSRTRRETVPLWDGSDAWPIEAAPATDDMAYVADGVLVSQLPEINLRIVYSSTLQVETDLVLYETWIIAPVTTDSDGFSISTGTLAGVAVADDVLRGLRLPASGDDTAQACSDDPIYPFHKESICGQADMSDGADDCDSVSLGMAFTSAAARVGPTFVLEPHMIACPFPDDDLCEYATLDPTLGDPRCFLPAVAQVMPTTSPECGDVPDHLSWGCACGDGYGIPECVDGTWTCGLSMPRTECTCNFTWPFDGGS